MKKKYLIGIIVGVIAAVVVITGIVIANMAKGTYLVEDSTISSFPEYKADTSYLFGFSFKKSGSLPIKIESIELTDGDGNEIKSDSFDWSILINNDDSVSIGAMIYDETNMLIDYSALDEFKKQEVGNGGINLALKIDSKTEQQKPSNCMVKVEYSVLWSTKQLECIIN